MAGIGVIFNPRSGRNRRDPSAVDRLARTLDSHGVIREVRSIEQLLRAAEEFRKLEVEVLAISGGDGTNALTMSSFLEVYAGSALPRVALLRGGTMNIVANSIGVPRRRPERLLDQVVRDYLARNSRPLHECQRHLLCLRAHGARRNAGDRASMPAFATKHGFLFGTGVVYGYLAELYAGGPASSLLAAKTLLRGLGSTLARGPMIRRMAEPFRGSAELDFGTLWEERDYLAIAGGTVDQIGLGFRPFHRCVERPGAFHVLGIYTSAFGFAAQLGRVWRGRPMRPGHAYDALVERVTIRCASSPLKYVVDGDLYECDGPLEVSIGPVVRLLVGNTERQRMSRAT